MPCEPAVTLRRAGTRCVSAIDSPPLCSVRACAHVDERSRAGAPKQWYGVPGTKAALFEHASQDFRRAHFRKQPHLLQNLTVQTPPWRLRAAGIEVYKLLQQPGDIIVTFPRAYHMGFSYGWNCAEAANFGMVDWIPHGSVASMRYRRDHREPVIVHERLLLNLLYHEREFGLDANAFVREELGRIASVENRNRQQALESGMWIVDMGVFCDEEQCRVRASACRRRIGSCSPLRRPVLCSELCLARSGCVCVPGGQRDCAVTR
jgi:histone demethylase JARID1